MDAEMAKSFEMYKQGKWACLTLLFSEKQENHQ